MKLKRFSKKKKVLIAAASMFIVVAGVFTATMLKPKAATPSTYQPSKALEFAKNHCNTDAKNHPDVKVKAAACDDGWICAQFVYNCLIEGDFPQKFSDIDHSCDYLDDTLANNKYCTKSKLKLEKYGNFFRVKVSDNKNLNISPGDAMCVCCDCKGDASAIKNRHKSDTRDYKHFVLVSSIQNGYVYVYAHNTRKIDEQFVTAGKNATYKDENGKTHYYDSKHDPYVYLYHFETAESVKPSEPQVTPLNAQFKVMAYEKSIFSSANPGDNKIGTVKQGQTIKVKGYVYNTYRTLYYLTTDNVYIHYSFLQCTSGKAPSDYGKMMFELKENAGNKQLFASPYSDSKVVKTLTKGSFITSNGYVTNAYGNKWYYTDNDEYFYTAETYAISLIDSKFRSRAAVKAIYNYPSAGTSRIGTVSENEIVSVKGYTYNDAGTLYYLTNNNKFVHCSYLDVISGKTQSTYYEKKYMVSSGVNKKLFSGSYQDSEVTRTLSEGKIINCIGELTNSYGNKWCLTADGDYFYLSDVTEIIKADAVYEVMASQKSLKNIPNGNETRVVKKGDKVTIVGYVFNEGGVIWFLTDKGDYMHPSYLKAISYSGELLVNYEPATYVVADGFDSKDINNTPYTNSSLSRSLKPGDTINVIGYVTNEAGNKWLLTDQGDYLYNSRIRLVK